MTSGESVWNILTDEPQWSSASLCVRLNHLGQSFRPEYTHQLVEGESWRGHRPLAPVLKVARVNYENSRVSGKESSTASSETTTTTIPSSSILHKSHQNHEAATSELEITVIIAPSCQACSVDIVRNAISDGNGGEEPVAKRPKTDPDATSLPDVKTTAESSRSTESSCRLPMTDSEIIGALSKALPPVASQSDETNGPLEEGFLSKPIGDLVEEYSVHRPNQSEDGPSESANFVLTIADGRFPEVSIYHNSVQKLALFYIENADAVDVAKDSDGGFWKIMYVFGKHPVNDDSQNGTKEQTKEKFRYSLVGYFTLFHFNALFHKPEPGWILRICQALVLPPFQSQGHGKRMLQAVYGMAHQTKQEYGTGNVRPCSEHDASQHQKIIQINVEDPAPAFAALRTKIDWQLVLQHHREWNWPQRGSIARDVETSKSVAPTDELTAFFSAMSEKEASAMSTKAKITTKQIHRTNELLKLRAVRSFLEEKSGQRISEEDRDTIDRCFRLVVKRRLNREHREELLEQPSKDDQKAMLARLFDEELKGYERILAKFST
mmetsp:Transcript_17603/g.48650  ORF Transcript_17603/g.48650 Transcript_17603/m.48650 type:complete len:551 (-) Transcript_17603:1762-3414(-)|eukprot:CAMPEP_0172377772 /NCGR_PEP_ID=MMETSP1060-20121228/69079_1 /TAXON_ID=37318 /ORGANISM="Pseudo-nitzschia pungens, Strain cf. cingulata" /LENGTH=550 /DNA_ID=CAMNT_0013105481 /DNA_START=4262 /DNA_END=5914 /DNA_ORIENTATION=-